MRQCLFTFVFCMYFVCLSAPCVLAQDALVEISKKDTLAENIIVEGFTNWIEQVSDREARKRLEKANKPVTPEAIKKMRMALAARAAQMDAQRNVVEYKQGLTFTFISNNNSLSVAKFKTQGIVRMSQNQFLGKKVFESGLYVVQLSVPRKTALQAHNDIRTYEVTGSASKSTSPTIMMYRQARTDAYCKLIRAVALEKYGPKLPEKISGRLYQIETVSDALTKKDYQVRLRVQIAID